MSNDNVLERVLKALITVGKLIVDGKRSSKKVAVVLQEIVDDPKKFSDLFKLEKSFRIVVPSYYNHETSLGLFFKKNSEKISQCFYEIADKNFKTRSIALKPGQEYEVSVFKQVYPGYTTYDERLDFVKNEQEGTVLVGVQGIALIFELAPGKLQEGYYQSFCNLPKKDNEGYIHEPLVSLFGGRYNFTIANLGSYECGTLMICFRKV